MIVGIVVSLFQMTDSDFPFIYIKVVYRLVISSDIQKEQKMLSRCHKPASGTLSLAWSFIGLMQEGGDIKNQTASP